MISSKQAPRGYPTVDIASKLSLVRRRIGDAANRAGRLAEDITLVAVTKTQPFSVIETAYKCGQRDFGENRLEELWPKVEEAQRRGLSDIRWHMIGTIQSRKTSRAVGPFELIHAVDRAKIARRLSRDADAANCVMPVLLEVNVSGEASKHGFGMEEVFHVVDELAALPGLRIEGLMTMAPLFDIAEETRPLFKALRTLRDQLMVRYPHMEWRHLSMGMTNDFEVAVEEGATIVRIGSAIFGLRRD